MYKYNKEVAMKKIFVPVFIITMFMSSICIAQDMSDGLNCPQGWNDNINARGNELIKQCVSSAHDAFIELYAAPGQSVPLGRLLDVWSAEMTKRGLPFQNFVSEQPGHVSGFPAVTRVYSGYAKNGAHFDSWLVASRYKGTNYIFQGLAMKGHAQAREQMRSAMNSWYYPGASSSSAGNRFGGLPLGSGNSNDSADRLSGQASINVDRHGNGCGAMLKIYDNAGQLIMDFQSSYVGNRPFSDEKIGGNWRSLKYKNFFKITAHNYADSEIIFTKLRVDSFRKEKHYCTKPNGQKYVCGEGKKFTKPLGNGSTVLRVNGHATNVLLPGQDSVKQGYNTFTDNNYKGKINRYTYFFTYRGKTFKFETCRQFR
jgi:hypothetical protein